MCKRRFSLAAYALTAALAFIAAMHGQGNIGPGTAAATGNERLVYKIQWDPPWYLFFIPKVDAGEVTLEFNRDAEYEGSKAFRISLKANSSGSLAKISGVKIEDEFVFHTEPGTYCTVSASEKIREGKRKRQIDVQYFREESRLHIREVDESDFGLQAGLFTKDMTVIHDAIENIEVGGLMVNDVSTFRIDHMPYGGVKDSGIGREGVRAAIEDMTEPRLLVMNLKPPAVS